MKWWYIRFIEDNITINESSFSWAWEGGPLIEKVSDNETKITYKVQAADELGAYAKVLEEKNKHNEQKQV